MKDRKLLVNPKEAETVRWIFDRYLVLKSVRALKEEMDASGVVTKVRTNAEGRISGGLKRFRGALYQILRNPLYVGAIRHRDQVYPGEHEAIVSRVIWDEVQKTMTDHAARHDPGGGVQLPKPAGGVRGG